MNKTEFLNAVAEKADLSKLDTKKAFEAFIETISEGLAAGDRISIVGFGTFSVTERAARKGINPKTQQTIEIPARKTVKFKAGSELAEKVKD
ncbi:MAG: HU family DNA-binding protein [Tannerellaceae bacterium]|jgi:DNA-binding protein HU-beta|nr:HU family DNA-binding protein [Tannerellaceae bacterium]